MSSRMRGLAGGVVLPPVLVLALAAAATCGAHAQPLVPVPKPPAAGLAQRPGAALPLDTPFTDSEGRRQTLGDSFGARPVLLAPGYYRCPQLCGLLMHGLLQALHDSGLRRDEYRVVRFSIDPQDTPATARQRRSLDLAYARFLEPAGATPDPLDLRLLTGSPAAIDALAAAVGLRFSAVAPPADDPAARFAHAAAVIVATPQGRISRVLPGIHFDAGELRNAVHEAGGGTIGSISRRVALLCANVDPRIGRHSEAVLWTLRGAGALTLAGVVALALRGRRR